MKTGSVPYGRRGAVWMGRIDVMNHIIESLAFIGTVLLAVSPLMH